MKKKTDKINQWINGILNFLVDDFPDKIENKHIRMCVRGIMGGIIMSLLLGTLFFFLYVLWRVPIIGKTLILTILIGGMFYMIGTIIEHDHNRNKRFTGGKNEKQRRNTKKRNE